MLYDYLDFATSLSWKTEEPAEIDLNEAEEILNEDHYGLKKVKERIIQQLAVMALNKKQSGSILLFVGAPGTGKTSIGQSIARALHRKYVRISLGGIRDESGNSRTQKNLHRCYARQDYGRNEEKRSCKSGYGTG